MGDFSFLAIPNVEGMRFLRYLKIFGIALMFGVCLFFLIYFIVLYRREKSLGRQFEIYDHKISVLEQDLFVQKIVKASGKSKILLFIEYLEKFATSNSYANISELLVIHGFSEQETEDIETILYDRQKPSQQLEIHINERILLIHKK